MTKIALIPARGGSKGVLGKNMQVINGKSLVELAVESAKLADIFDEIWVSSDDEETLSQAEKLGVRVHRRSSSASSDTATANDVVFNFLRDEAKTEHTSLCYLQPTSPFRTAEHVVSSLGLHETNYSVPVISVKEASEIPEKLFTAVLGGALLPYLSQKKQNINRQDAPQYLYPNGAIYVFTVGNFQAERGFPITNALPFIMNSLESLDIDSYEDLWLARRMVL